MTIDWKECCNKGVAKNVKPDMNMINALIKSSRNKLESETRLPMNEVTACSKLSLAYDSLRELLEALAIQNGYKIYNHECYSAFMKEVICETNKGDEFDEIRKIRNAVNYYGKDITTEEANEMISKMKNLRAFVLNSLKR